ncbi:hypothetical protein C8K38_111216 [Rhodococcus sp. OK611]|uniref:hypothetical protein n=1 Tax=unclassified Rhodococcus (in: high G+C Gram-positive bacteria) TaxID=192944 RepID=UPI000BD6A7A4|nr:MULTISPECIES: hypothetical protein [unclassified Rhodococcus (in: high G+C Gram-positive bacteria)]PTR42047.1 hypothetical protein C8K38_111216 [Rhodococcus sp. OK611]SNX91506.1 hypothetical protein SAMN05447004_11041 [Rhodococcus sp. OK270]
MSATSCASGAFLPPDPDSLCCYGAAVYGDRCTCWTAVLDIEPSTAVEEGPNEANAKCCHDCAFRAGSPEREEMGGDPMPYRPDHPFYCHTGFPHADHYTHPETDQTIPGRDGDYQPITHNGRTWRADGRPALVCAGWAAFNRAADSEQREEPHHGA